MKRNDKMRNYRKTYLRTLSGYTLHEKARKKYKNSEQFKTKSKEYYFKNKKKILKTAKEFRLKIMNGHKPSHSSRNLINKEYLLNPKFRWQYIIRQRFNTYLKSQKVTSKNLDLKELIGLTPSNLRKHIESKFKTGMNWKNRKDWHIDHILPLSLADNKNPISVKKVMNYKNLRPLWSQENIKKSNIITKYFTKLHKLEDADKFVKEVNEIAGPFKDVEVEFFLIPQGGLIKCIIKKNKIN